MYTTPATLVHVPSHTKLTLDQMTACNMTEVAVSDELKDNYHLILLVALSTMHRANHHLSAHCAGSPDSSYLLVSSASFLSTAGRCSRSLSSTKLEITFLHN